MAIDTLGAALRRINHLFADGVVTGLSDAQLLERFVRGHDGAAFEALVARHGPMVLGVCRGILKDPNDAEDAFQATFLILVKNAGAFRGPVALGPWLYRVAYRVALRANAAAARRRECERRAGQMATATSTPGPAGPDEASQVLHEELARLPEKLRRVVILCDLQRVPRSRAAGELRLSESTLHRRLSEGRERLKARLIRRGLASEGGMLGAVFLPEAQIAVPAAWCQTAVRAALATVNRTMAAGGASAAAQQWTREVLTIMWLRKLMLTSASLLAAALIAWGASAALVAPSDEPPRKMAEASPPRKAAVRRDPDAGGPAAVSGRVIGPDGKPVAGAKLYLTPAMGYLKQPYPSSELTTTGADGRFAFPVPDPEYPKQTTRITAAAPGYGPGWVEVPADGRKDDLTIPLVPDDVPITGRIIDLEGKPVRGASLRLMQINAAPDENLDRWLAAARVRKGITFQLEHGYLGRETIAPSPTVTTDAEGRFRLTGIGRDRLVRALIEGPTIVSEYLHILTRPGKSIEVTEFEGQREYGDPRVLVTYYGADFRHAVAPCKPIVGVVRDRDTKKPLAGVTIRSYTRATRPHYLDEIARTVTDPDGRYRLTGMPRGRGNRILAIPGEDQPYPARAEDVPDQPGLDPVTVDVELRRGVWIEGKITDKVTGKPLWASVEYFSRFSNPNLRDYPGFDGAMRPFEGVRTREDGSYRIIGLPGPGLVAVFHRDEYLRADERDDAEGVKEDSLRTAPYHISFTSNYSALAPIDPARGAESIKRDVTLDPGWAFTGKVLGPDGRPLAGAWGMGIGLLKTPEFTMRGFNPHRPEGLLFRHPEKGLVGAGRPPKDNGGSITVRLEPGATLTGRLLDAEGRPQADVGLKVYFRPKEGPRKAGQNEYGTHERIRTDREGRFRVEALPAGYLFRLLIEKGDDLISGDGLRAGQTRDLGDVRVKERRP